MVRINDQEVPREMWPLVKPKATREDRPITITMHAALMGGGGDGDKSGLALIATLVLVVAATAASRGAFGPGYLGAAFGPGTTGAALLGAGIPATGLCVAALVPASESGGDREPSRKVCDLPRVDTVTDINSRKQPDHPPLRRMAA